MKLPIIQSLWIGDSLSNFERLCVQSFLDHSHEFHLYAYGEVAGIPSGATVKDGNEILPKELIGTVGKNRYALFSDWFRFALLAKRGGWWVDMDTVCIRPFDFTDEIVFAFAENLRIHSTPLRFPPGHECMRALANACRNHTDPQPWDTTKDRRKKAKMRFLKHEKNRVGIFDWGPILVEKAMHHFGLLDHGKPYQYFFSCDHPNWEYAFDNSFSDGLAFHRNAYSIHLYNSVVNQSEFLSKNANYPAGSMFEQLKAKHGIKPDTNAPTLTHDQMRKWFFDSKAKQQQKRNARKLRQTIVALALIFLVFAIGLLI